MRVETPEPPTAAGRAQAQAQAPEDYRVASADDRLALLLALRDGSVPVLLHTDDGHALRTTLWVVDTAAARLAFALQGGRGDAEVPPHVFEPLLEADEVTAIAHPGDVRVQFELQGLVLVRGNSSAVLQSALPTEMLRFQRRESYRVCPPVGTPVAYLRHPSIPEMQLSLRVLDLSLGGCALRLPDDVPALPPGTCLAGVTIELDLNTRFGVELTLQHITHIGAPGQDRHGNRDDDGAPVGARIGCEWRLVRPEDERALQRWIDQAQKRLRLVRGGSPLRT
jgi:flagellar brake protein